MPEQTFILHTYELGNWGKRTLSMDTDLNPSSSAGHELKRPLLSILDHLTTLGINLGEDDNFTAIALTGIDEILTYHPILSSTAEYPYSYLVTIDVTPKTTEIIFVKDFRSLLQLLDELRYFIELLTRFADKTTTEPDDTGFPN